MSRANLGIPGLLEYHGFVAIHEYAAFDVQVHGFGDPVFCGHARDAYAARLHPCSQQADEEHCFSTEP